ncbi:hypothetical protein KCU83_g59, partial [Aureobasidium melanogenum]
MVSKRIFFEPCCSKEKKFHLLFSVLWYLFNSSTRSLCVLTPSRINLSSSYNLLISIYAVLVARSRARTYALASGFFMAAFVFRLAIIGSAVFSGSVVSLAGVASLELEVVAATADDLDDDFFLRFFSIPAFLAPLSFRPPPADVYSDDGMAGVKEVAMEGGRWGCFGRQLLRDDCNDEHYDTVTNV